MFINLKALLIKQIQIPLKIQSTVMLRQQDRHETFLKLVSISGSNLVLHKPALQLIDNFLDGPIALVTMQGSPSVLFRHVMHQKFQNAKFQHPESCILIGVNSNTDLRTKKSYFLLETYANSEEDRIKLHLLAAAISTLIVVNVTYESNLGFLSGLNGRCIVSQKKDKPLRENIASLVALMRFNDSGSNNEVPLKDYTNQFMNLLQIQNVVDYTRNNYDCIGGYWLPEDHQLQHVTDSVYVSLFEKFTKDYNSKENADMMYGPVLKSYIQNLVAQINRSGMIVLEKAQDDIEIQQGYEAYKTAVDRYHQFCKQDFRDTPVNNLEGVCLNNRSKAEDTFNKLSSDAKYLSKLNHYITHKEQQLRTANNQLHDQRNLQILRRQSQGLVQKVKSAKSQNRDVNFIKGDIEGIVVKYERDAAGDNKHKLLTQYLSTFTSSLYGDQGGSNSMIDKDKERDMRKMLEKRNEENKQLKNRLKQMEKNNKGCCEIM